MCPMCDGMGGWIAGMMTYGAVIAVLVVVVLFLVAVWLFQQVRRDPGQGA